MNLIQLVRFPTWSRTINNSLCSSIIDHIYTRNPTAVQTIYPIIPSLGDHQEIILELYLEHTFKLDAYRRNWINYNPAKLFEQLQTTNWPRPASSVEDRLLRNKFSSSGARSNLTPGFFQAQFICI